MRGHLPSQDEEKLPFLSNLPFFVRNFALFNIFLSLSWENCALFPCLPPRYGQFFGATGSLASASASAVQCKCSTYIIRIFGYLFYAKKFRLCAAYYVFLRCFSIGNDKHKCTQNANGQPRQ